MFGNIILYFKEKWQQFWCIHDYKPDRIGIATGLSYNRVCCKCGKVER
jgi:hypothetical protein